MRMLLRFVTYFVLVNVVLKKKFVLIEQASIAVHVVYERTRHRSAVHIVLLRVPTCNCLNSRHTNLWIEKEGERDSNMCSEK